MSASRRGMCLAGIDLPFKVWLSYTTGSFIDKKDAVKGAAESGKNIDKTVDKIMAEALT